MNSRMYAILSKYSLRKKLFNTNTEMECILQNKEAERGIIDK
jgi:hypothetical protein